MTPAELMAKAEQALRSAQVLLAAGDADGACNRAYYAMFDATRASLLGSGRELGKTHRGVLNAFSEAFVKDGPLPKETGRLLKHAESLRYVADYEGDAVQPAVASELVSQASDFLAALRTAFFP